MELHYVCDHDTKKALRGPLTNIAARRYLNELPEAISRNLCNLSRSDLANLNVYPLTVVGEIALKNDLNKSLLNI